MDKQYRTTETAPTDVFIDSIAHGGGSAYQTCTWCNRVHMCPDSNFDPPDYGTSDDRAEWRRVCEQTYKDNPSGTVLHYDTDCISDKNLNGLTFVVGCPCNGLSRYESFIWNERGTIRQYLERRIKMERDWAEQEMVRNKLAGFTDPDNYPYY